MELQLHWDANLLFLLKCLGRPTSNFKGFINYKPTSVLGVLLTG